MCGGGLSGPGMAAARSTSEPSQVPHGPPWSVNHGKQHGTNHNQCYTCQEQPPDDLECKRSAPTGLRSKVHRCREVERSVSTVTSDSRNSPGAR
jgi:hypothetical protein